MQMSKTLLILKAMGRREGMRGVYYMYVWMGGGRVGGVEGGKEGETEVLRGGIGAWNGRSGDGRTDGRTKRWGGGTNGWMLL